MVLASTLVSFIFLMIFVLCVLLFYLHTCLCEGVRSAAGRVTVSYALPCECWELNPGPREEQPVLLTIDPSLPSLGFSFVRWV